MEAGLSCSSSAGSKSGSPGSKASLFSSKLGSEDLDGEPYEEAADDAAAEDVEMKDVADTETSECTRDSKLGGDKVDDKGPCSSTHRKEYMALSRKMETLDPSKFPEMAQMWSASKAEPRNLY